MTVAAADDVGEAQLLGTLLRRCPFPMMRAAIVGLIREAVHRNMSLTTASSFLHKYLHDY
jgi:hypothetical protein